MSDRNSTFYLQDMLDSINAINIFLVGINRDNLEHDRKTYSATIRELEIIGEAASKVDVSIQNSNPEVPWRILKDLRNVLAHHYFGINLDIVWDIIHNKLPDLKVQIERIIG